MASTYIDLSKENDEFVKVVQEDSNNSIQLENQMLLGSILQELKIMNIHLSIVSNEEDL